MRRNPVIRTLAAALLTGGAIVGVGAVASPASAATTTDGVGALSHGIQANGGCRFGAGFNRGFNAGFNGGFSPFCGFGYGSPFGAGYFPFGGYPYGNSTTVVIVR